MDIWSGWQISSSISKALRMVQQSNPALKFVGEKRPQYELNEVVSGSKARLLSLPLRSLRQRELGLKKLKIMDTPLVLLVSPENPKATDDATVDDFRHEPFITRQVFQQGIIVREREIVHAANAGSWGLRLLRL